MDVKEQIDRRAMVFATCFSTVAGAEVLETLMKSHQPGNLFDPDPVKLARNVGGFEVVQAIVELVERGRKNGNNG